jgi:hypothetical protein
MKLRALLPLALALLALPATAQQEPSAARLKLLQQEKLRIFKARSEILIKGKGTYRDFFKVAYQNIARGNKKQAEENVRRVAQCRQGAATARQKRLEKKLKAYLKLGQLYERYAKRNRDVVKAYGAFDSGKISEAMAEIEAIEQEIMANGLRPAKRDWFTMKEIDKTPMPGQKMPQNTKRTKGTATRN